MMGVLDYIKFRFFSEKPNAHNGDKFVEFIDAMGRPVLVNKEKYRVDILPSFFRAEWNNPDNLYIRIIGSLDDGLAAECIEPAKRLLEIDPNVERSKTVYGIVLNKNGKYREAEEFFKSCLAGDGESAAMLCNLAKSYSFQHGTTDLVINTLWRSLELDPNIQNSVGWFASIERERAGEAGYVAALERISALTGSWQADLWLAKHALESKNLDKALALYEKIFQVSSNDSEALFQASGDLGKNGHSRTMVELVGPLYNMEQHGYKPAMNLMQAYVELDERDKGCRLLKELRSLNRPDLVQHVLRFERLLKCDQSAGV